MELIPPSVTALERIVRTALAEDIDRGDLTTEACIPLGTESVADLFAREPMVVSGFPVIEEVFAQVDGLVDVTTRVGDGGRVERGDVIGTVEGPAASILMGERVALNFMQRMSGIATMTRQFVDALPEGSKTRITDTRKTTPGLRAFERYAVRCGGGINHREDLGSGVLIKDNHIAAAGGVRQAIERARAHAPHTYRVECEVESNSELDDALEARADIIMLDNFDNDGVAKAIEKIDGRAIVEVSGGITLERVTALGKLGVDVISVGALTHSSPSCDIALDWRT